MTKTMTKMLVAICEAVNRLIIIIGLAELVNRPCSNSAGQGSSAHQDHPTWMDHLDPPCLMIAAVSFSLMWTLTLNHSLMIY